MYLTILKQEFSNNLKSWFSTFSGPQFQISRSYKFSSLLIGSAFVKITDQKITGNLLIICIGYHCTQNTKDPDSILSTYQGLRPTDIEPLLSSVIPHQTTNTIFDIPSILITFLNQCLLTHKSLGLSLRTDYKPWPSTSVFFIIIKF